MANRYWVLGTGTWNSTNTANWSTSSGGGGGASVPTAADDVFFDANSDTLANPFTVTMANSPRVCNNITISGIQGGMTLAGTNIGLTVSGSLSFPATNFTRTYTGTTTFNATTTGKTVTTNGVTFSSPLVFNGAGGGWTLGSALTVTNASITVTAGTFATGNFNVTASQLSSSNSNTRTITLGSSTVTLSDGLTPLSFATSTNLTFNANTSQITFTGVGSAQTFPGGGQTFYNVSWTGTSQNFLTISDTNTFNNLTFTTPTTNMHVVTLDASQIVNGTLTLGAANTAVRRIFLNSSALGSPRTITLNGSLATLADVDFRDITAAGSVARPWTGTRLGNCGGNTDITFDAGKTVYWNLAGTQNWSATGWATTNNGSPSVNNFPLAQDTAVFTEAGSAGTVTINTNWNIGTIQMADGVSNRTTAFTLTATTGAAGSAFIYGNVTLFTNLTLSGTSTLTFAGTGTQTLTSAGVTFTQQVTINKPSSTTFLLNGACTLGTGNTFTLTQGTLDLNGNTLSTGIFSSNNSNTRAITFGSANIALTSTTAATTVLSMATATNFTMTTSGGGFTRNQAATATVNFGATTGGTASNAPNLTVNAGASALTVTTGSYLKNVVFTGSTSTVSATYNACGNLTLATGGTYTSVVPTFIASGTLTSTGKTLGNTTVNGSGITVTLADAANCSTLTFTNGTLNLAGFTFTSTTTAATAAGTKNLTFNGGTLVCSAATTTAWNNAQPTNFTTTAGTGTGTISMTAATAKTFVGGGSTYNCTLNQGGAGTLTITGANTFNNITNSNATASQITFPASTTTTVSSFTLSGSAGNLVSLRSSTPATQFTLSDASGTVSVSYLDIQDSNATGGASWNAYLTNGNVNSGNNTGWVFSASNFLMFFLS